MGEFWYYSQNEKVFADDQNSILPQAELCRSAGSKHEKGKVFEGDKSSLHEQNDHIFFTDIEQIGENLR